ncbi:MAG: NADH-quinone oxidoreductase subunit N [Burkholderiaceae bacterium]|nr:MAG: NADH-quinone oxidoreductase subunit N [Burkholderiaceae bacterium]
MHTFNSLNILLASTEIILFGLIILFLLLSLLVGKSKELFLSRAFLVSLFVFGFYMVIDSFSNPTIEYGFNGMYVIDPISVFSKGFICIVFALALLYCEQFLNLMKISQSEFFLLSSFGLLGQFLMMSASHLLIIYLGIELVSLSLISLIALNRESSASIEAAIKFFVLAALASGFLLYGISMIYGATGTLQLNEIADQILSDGANPIIVVFGLVFVVCGLAFKLGAVPFHMWVPDIYQGAALPSTLLIGSTPKVAAVLMIYRILFDGFYPLLEDWKGMFIILAFLSLGLGNLVAILQKSFKRLMGYSTIGHVGFLVGAIASMNYELTENLVLEISVIMGLFAYIFIYLLSFLGALGCVLLLAKEEKISSDLISDLRFMVKANPVVAWCMVLFMLSMAGIPPTIGFYTKFVILESMVAADLVWLAVFAVLFSVVGAFYYLRIVKVILFDGMYINESVKKVQLSFMSSAFLIINGSIILILGLFPDIMFEPVTRLVEFSFFSN